eukprot:NODE_65_length_25825_cov_1.353844.p17 type:complete len:167 gc:universal NODE_65_length_25825_cov_1.353844:24393-23893(-)
MKLIHKEFLKVAQQQLKDISGHLNEKGHIDCLNIIKIATPKWNSYQNSDQYFGHLESYFRSTESDVKNLLKWHSNYKAKEGNSKVSVLSERLIFPKNFQWLQDVETLEDDKKVLDIIMNNVYPVGEIKVLPSRHSFRKWFLEQSWPDNISFQPFLKKSGAYKVKME